MIYQIILTSLLIIKTSSHTPKNDSDVIITYAGHAEANLDTRPILIPKTTTVSTTKYEYTRVPEHKAIRETTEYFIEDGTEGVVFVPNERDFRDDFLSDDTVRVGDLMAKKTVNDLIGGKTVIQEEETPNRDILFITGKNKEGVETQPKKEPKHTETRRTGSESKKINMDCSNLDCNNTLKAICGAKLEQNKWKYRLFLNECFFSKVNCGFKYELNRYQVVSDEKCKHIGAHYKEPPFTFNPVHLPTYKKENARRSLSTYSSRRSLNVGLDGNFCSHACPSTCPEEYDPDCAVSANGIKKVFVNHCKLDFNSCFYKTVWYRRPLSECVGNQKADMRSNRSFISWMQRVGIVDNKGKIVLS